MTRCTVSGNEPTNPATAPTPTDELRADGQKKDHWVMCPGEIIKAGYKRPVRLKYQHVGIPGPRYALRDLTPEERERWGHQYAKYEPYPPLAHGSALGHLWTQADLDKIGKGCGVVTSMPMACAETYAANPGYYGSTFCCGCGTYLPVGERGEFVWDGTSDRVGT
jgi:hypothetical protein